jgi:hypothetical protein
VLLELDEEVLDIGAALLELDEEVLDIVAARAQARRRISSATPCRWRKTGAGLTGVTCGMNTMAVEKFSKFVRTVEWK